MWICKQCDEKIEDSFDACWNCGYDKTGKQIMSESFEKIKKENKMEFSMDTKEKALCEKLGAIVVLIGNAGKYLACFEKNCKVGMEKKLLQRGSSSDFSYNNIRQVALVEGGMVMNGYIYLNVGGDTPARVFINNPNAVLIGKSRNTLANEIKSFIENNMNEQPSDSQNVVVELSGADELKKYAELKEQGIISQEEFDAKKKELLGL